MSFLTQLNRTSHPIVVGLIKKYVFESVRNMPSILKQPLSRPTDVRCISVEGYWVCQGNREPQQDEGYVLTDSVRANLSDLARIVAGRYV